MTASRIAALAVVLAAAMLPSVVEARSLRQQPWRAGLEPVPESSDRRQPWHPRFALSAVDGKMVLARKPQELGPVSLLQVESSSKCDCAKKSSMESSEASQDGGRAHVAAHAAQHYQANANDGSSSVPSSSLPERSVLKRPNGEHAMLQSTPLFTAQKAESDLQRKQEKMQLQMAQIEQQMTQLGRTAQREEMLLSELPQEEAELRQTALASRMQQSLGRPLRAPSPLQRQEPPPAFAQGSGFMQQQEGTAVMLPQPLISAAQPQWQAGLAQENRMFPQANLMEQLPVMQQPMIVAQNNEFMPQEASLMQQPVFPQSPNMIMQAGPFLPGVAGLGGMQMMPNQAFSPQLVLPQQSVLREPPLAMLQGAPYR